MTPNADYGAGSTREMAEVLMGLAARWHDPVTAAMQRAIERRALTLVSEDEWRAELSRVRGIRRLALSPTPEEDDAAIRRVLADLFPDASPNDGSGS